MAGDFISIAKLGSSSRGYLALPEAGSGPGLVLFCDVSDGEGELRELGELYAAEGYVVLCPEPFAVANGVEDVVATVAALRARRECPGKIGAIGFGLGGKLACLLTTGVAREAVPFRACPYQIGAGPSDAFRRRVLRVHATHRGPSPAKRLSIAKRRF